MSERKGLDRRTIRDRDDSQVSKRMASETAESVAMASGHFMFCRSSYFAKEQDQEKGRKKVD